MSDTLAPPAGMPSTHPAGPDPLARGMEPSPAQEAARREFAAFVDAHVAPFAGEWDRAAATPPEVVRRVAGTGWLGALLPREVGGRGMDWATFGLLNEELGRGCSSIRSLLTVHSMCAFAVQRWGGRELKARLLPQLAAGEVIGAFGLSEPNVGSDASAVETVAAAEGDGYVIDGRKKWTTYGQIAGAYLVFARSEGKPVAFLVERDAPGLTVEPLRGITGTRASMLAELRFEGCRVPKSNRLGGPGFGIAVALSALEVGRFSVASGTVGLVRACLDASLAYASTRHQYGSAIGEHQLVQRMLTEMATGWRAARLLCRRAACLRDAGDPGAGQEIFVAKYFASQAATRAALDAVQIHGANGCSEDHPVERYLRDSRVMEIIEGSTQIQQVTIARNELQAFAAAAPAQ
ncbi:MAG: acyl-CoA dehydrogenase domain protein [Gemmatimonadetes bacterium]|nr:acyl-CoA dehydrogenase domain protein [Gemmatimonadota bacterium]